MPSDPLHDISDKLESFKLEVTQSMTRQETLMENMSTRLFGGNGQTGALLFLTEQHSKLAEKIDHKTDELDTKIDTKADDKDLKELEDKHDDLSTRVSWYGGIGAAIAFLISTLFTYLGFHPIKQ